MPQKFSLSGAEHLAQSPLRPAKPEFHFRFAPHSPSALRAAIYKVEKSHSQKSFSKAKDVETRLFWAPVRGSARVGLGRAEFAWEVEVVERPPVLKWAVSFDEDTKGAAQYHEGLFEWQLRFQNRQVADPRKSRLQAFYSQFVLRLRNPLSGKYLGVQASSRRDGAVLVEQQDCRSDGSRAPGSPHSFFPYTCFAQYFEVQGRLEAGRGAAQS